MRSLRVRFFIALLSLIVLTLLAFGCGGGGGGAGPVPVSEHRSISVVSNNASTTVGSEFHKTVKTYWWGVDSHKNFGLAAITSFVKTGGTGTLSLNPDGTLDLSNDRAYDTFTFTFVAIHPSGTGDPDAGKEESGSATIVITPDKPRLNPSAITVAQGGSVVLTAQAENSRAAGIKIARVDATKALTRLFVTTPATWSVSPTAAGTFQPNSDGTVTFTASAAFSGSVVISAAITGSSAVVTANGTVVPHPSIIVSSPTEGQTITGTSTTVAFNATNATSVTYNLDGGAPVNVTGQSSFTISGLSSGTHTLVMSAQGQLETASITRHFVTSTYSAGANRKLVLLGDAAIGVKTDTMWGARLANGEYVSYGSATLVRVKSDGSAVVQQANVPVLSSGNTPCLTGDEHVVIPDPNNNRLFVYTATDFTVSPRIVNGIPFASAAAAVPGQNKVLVASSNGVYQVNTTNWTDTLLFAEDCSLICTDGTYIWLVRSSDGMLAEYDLAGNQQGVDKNLTSFGGVVASLYTTQTDNTILLTIHGGANNGVAQLDKTMTEITGSRIPAPASIVTWGAFGPDNTAPEHLFNATAKQSLQHFQFQ